MPTFDLIYFNLLYTRVSPLFNKVEVTYTIICSQFCNYRSNYSAFDTIHTHIEYTRFPHQLSLPINRGKNIFNNCHPIAMKRIPKDDIIQMGLGLLKIMGERMHFKSKVLNFFRIFNITIMVVNLFFVLAYYQHIGADYAKYIKATECALTILHVSFYCLFVFIVWSGKI